MIIGLSGLKSSGKTTIAERLVGKHGFVALSFGSALKDITSELLDLPRELLEGDTMESREWRESYIHPQSGKTPRTLLQQVGTSMRDVCATVWIDALAKSITDFAMQKRDIVVVDVRFSNEMDLMLEMGEMWRVESRDSDRPLWYSNLQENCGDLDFRHVCTPDSLEYRMAVFGYTEHISETLLSLPSALDEMSEVIDNDGTLDQLYSEVDHRVIKCQMRNE